MNRRPFIILLILTFLAEILVCAFFYTRAEDMRQDSVKVNECLMSIKENYGNESLYVKSMDYALLDGEGNVLYKTSDNVSDSINEAVVHNDTILDIDLNGENGKIIFRNNTLDTVDHYKNRILITMIVFSGVQSIIMISCFIYIHKTMIEPFEKMSTFAKRVAEGDLDIPLYVDKKHIFGSFTESFDIMRSELRKARINEKKAADDKKEMVAKLSHDLKTPVASIKSSSEIGYELAKEDKVKEYFNLINIKSDQITVLVDNLFNSSVQDIKEIPVSPVECDSSILTDIIRNSDYLSRCSEYEIPGCMIFADRLRLQQAFDNVFMNSYKYADTDIRVESRLENEYLYVRVSDKGPGVTDEELPLLKEKYKRGENASGKEGAGLGLYLANSFIEAMNGELYIENADPGLAVIFKLRTI